MSHDATEHTWWVICEHELGDALRRAAAGEDVDVILLELFANSETEEIE